MKIPVIIISILFFLNHNLAGQTRNIKGRVISEDMETLPKVRIQKIDTVLIGETDIDGRFNVNIPTESEKLLFSWVGMEWATVTLPDNCENIEIILLADWIGGPKSHRKQDRIRKRRYKSLPKLHLEAFNKGLFITDKACYLREFEPYKPSLDSIRNDLKIKRKQIKKVFKALAIGDTIRIPYSVGNKGYDGTDRTPLFNYSYVVNENDFECIIEGIVLDKKKSRKGYIVKYEVTNCDSCNYDSTFFGKKDMVVGEVFMYNLKYFKILIE